MRQSSFALLGVVAALTGCQQEAPVPAEAVAPAAAPSAAEAPSAAALSGPPAGNRLEPRPGLWRITLERAGATMPETCAKPEDTEALRQAQAAASGGRTCNSDNPFRREGEAWVARTKCDLHAGGRSETVMSVTGDLNTRYRVEVVTTHVDVPSDSLPDTRVAYSAERVGDC